MRTCLGFPVRPSRSGRVPRPPRSRQRGQARADLPCEHRLHPHGLGERPVGVRTPSAPAPRELSREYRFALSALMVITGTAVVFLLIVVILTILSTILTSGADIPGWK